MQMTIVQVGYCVPRCTVLCSFDDIPARAFVVYDLESPLIAAFMILVISTVLLACARRR